MLKEIKQLRPYRCGGKKLINFKNSKLNLFILVCGNHFKNLSRLKAHKSVHTWVHNFWQEPEKAPKVVEEINKLQCNICGCVELTGLALKRHKRKHKEVGEKKRKSIDLKCKFCGKVCHTEDSMRMHVYHHRKKNLKHDIPCTFNGCHENFFSAVALEMHLFKKHPIKGRIFCCDVS
jgi:hypothetical protein